MRGVLIAALLIAIGASSTGFAEPLGSPNLAPDRLEKRRLVAEYLHLEPRQAAGFWPLYERLQAELQILEREREDHVRNYGRDYGGMTDALALAYTKEWLQHEEQRLRLLRQYLPRFEKVVPARTLARYYQIEDKIQAAVSAEAAVEIPLIQ